MSATASRDPGFDLLQGCQGPAGIQLPVVIFPVPGMPNTAAVEGRRRKTRRRPPCYWKSHGVPWKNSCVGEPLKYERITLDEPLGVLA